MPTVKQLKIAANAGEPDSVLALRIDVIIAAVAWYNALHKGDTIIDSDWAGQLDEAEAKLETVVRRYKAALKRRYSHDV